MGTFTKAVASCVKKKLGYYWQNNECGNKLLFVELDQYIIKVYQEVKLWWVNKIS